MAHTLLQLGQSKTKVHLKQMQFLGFKYNLTQVSSRSHHPEYAMIITLVIRNGIIALNLIIEHKIEAKWFPG